jgi:hypothetical protein
MKRTAEKHLEEAAAFIAVAESGDAKLAAYRKAAEEIEAAKQDDPSLSNREIGRRLGKDPNYARRLLDALSRARDTGEFQIDWQRKDREQVGAEKVAREQPEAFARAFAQASPKAQRQIARQIVAQPTPARRFIEQELSRQNAVERKRQIEEANRQRDATAAPLPAYMSRMVVKINEWAAGLASIEPDLEALPEGRGREMVLDVLRELARQTQRCIDRLEPRKKRSDDVIEGRAA